MTYENAKILENVKNQLLNKFDESYTHNRYLFPEDGSRVEQSGFSHQSNTKFNMKNLYIREASRVHTPFIVNAKIAEPNFGRKPRTQQIGTRKMINEIPST